MTLPGPVPAANFWSFMIYSSQTRSILETDQKTGGADSASPDIKTNDDGSYEIPGEFVTVRGVKLPNN